MNRKTKKRVDGKFKVESFLVRKGEFGATYYCAESDSLGIGFSSMREEAERIAKEELLYRIGFCKDQER